MSCCHNHCHLLFRKLFIGVQTLNTSIAIPIACFFIPMSTAYMTTVIMRMRKLMRITIVSAILMFRMWVARVVM